MRKPVILPDLGAPAATLSVWFVRPGDSVYAGDRLVEVMIKGATFDVTSPVTGRFAETWAFPDEPLTPGQTLGIVEEEAI
jgi:pyruvate/2-oxoglutarate dehydrogenase complex dihydrolipoamide acyltransferase (E2) component